MLSWYKDPSSVDGSGCKSRGPCGAEVAAVAFIRSLWEDLGVVPSLQATLGRLKPVLVVDYSGPT